MKQINIMSFIQEIDHLKILNTYILETEGTNLYFAYYY